MQYWARGSKISTNLNPLDTLLLRFSSEHKALALRNDANGVLHARNWGVQNALREIDSHAQEGKRSKYLYVMQWNALRINVLQSDHILLLGIQQHVGKLGRL